MKKLQRTFNEAAAEIDKSVAQLREANARVALYLKGHTERCCLRIGHQGPHLFVKCADSFKPIYWECQTRKCVEGR